MLVCMTCDTQIESGQKECKKCGGATITCIPTFFLQYNPNQTSPQVVTSVKTDSKFKRPSEVRSNVVRREIIPFYPMFGTLPLHFRMLLFGKYGSGKSSLALKLSEMMSTSAWRGLTAYVCAEEGSESATMQQKLEEQNITSDNVILVNTLEDMESAITDLGVKNVVLDSVNRLHLNVHQVTDLYGKISGALVLIAHCTKSLDFKGESGYAHDADIVASVDRGMLCFEKNRFHRSGEVYQLWECEVMENDR